MSLAVEYGLLCATGARGAGVPGTSANVDDKGNGRDLFLTRAPRVVGQLLRRFLKLDHVVTACTPSVR